MKNLMPALVITSLMLIVSTNTCFAQQPEERTKAELNEAKTQEVKLRIEKAYLRDIKKEKSLNTRPVKTRVKLKAEPAQIKLNKSKL